MGSLFLTLSWSCIPSLLSLASACQKLVLTGQTPFQSRVCALPLARISGGTCTGPLPGAAALTFHNGHDFKPTCMSSGHKGQGRPNLQPCPTLLGMVSSPRAFPVTLGSPALVASWPHCRVGLGTQSWWRCCCYLCVTLGKITPSPQSSFPSPKNTRQHKFSASPGRGDSTSQPVVAETTERGDSEGAWHSTKVTQLPQSPELSLLPSHYTP